MNDEEPWYTRFLFESRVKVEAVLPAAQERAPDATAHGPFELVMVKPAARSVEGEAGVKCRVAQVPEVNQAPALMRHPCSVPLTTPWKKAEVELPYGEVLLLVEPEPVEVDGAYLGK